MSKKKKYIPEFKTDEASLREYLTPHSRPPKPEEPPPPEFTETINDFWVLIRQHIKTGAKYLEKDDMKIWIFPLEGIFSPGMEAYIKERKVNKEGYAPVSTWYWEDKKSTRQRMFVPPYVTRMICDLGIYSLGKDSLIPEEQKNLFGYQEYVDCFPNTPSSMNYSLDHGDDFHQTDKAAIHICITHKIPSRHVSDLVGIVPTQLYKIARSMEMTFDYKGRFESRRIPYKNWRKFRKH